MADNVPITPGSGRDIATDDVGSVHYQKIKIALGADGAVDTLLDAGQQLSADSVPVVLASDQPDIKITLDGEQVVISGTVQVQSNSANLATEATAAAIQAAIELLDTAVSEGAINVGITAGGPLGFAAEPEATGDGNIIGILKRLRTLLSGTLAVSDDGTHTALNSVLASLGYIQPDTAQIAAALAGTLAVSVSTLPLPTGAATAANQTTTNTRLSSIDTSAGDIVNETSGTNSNTLAIATGTGATTDAEATGDGTVIAILKRTRTLIGNVATSVSGILAAIITEDAAAGASPTGAVAMSVQDLNRAGGNVTNDGDAQALRTNYFGDLYVKDTDASGLLTQIWASLGYTIGTDTQTVVTNTGAATTSLAVIDDWDESDRAKVNLIPGQAGVSAGAGTVAANTPRVTLASNDPSIGHLSDIVASVQNMEFSTDLLAATTKREDDPHANNDRGIPALAVRRDSMTANVSADGDYATLGVDSSGRLQVTDADTLSAFGELLNALTSYGADAIQMSGDIPHDSGDGNSPVKIGHVAKNFDGSAPGTPVAEDDRVNSIADVYGRQYVEITHPAHWTVSADYASAQTNTSLKSAPGAGLKLYITDVIVSNGATAGNITLLNGSGGSVLLELYPGVNGGLAHSFRTPIALSANTALAITSTTVTTHSVTICGYTAP